MRVLRAEGYSEVRDALSHDWIRWSDSRGALPLTVPNAMSNLERFLDIGAPELIVLTGGNDAVSGRPGGDAEPIRDRCEHALLEYAADRDIPVLAVCRGMHVLNLHFGGRVVGALPDDGASHAGKVHELAFEPIASAAVGRKTAIANSFHRQGIVREDVAPGFSVLATCARDGIVEALAHPGRRMIGVQWHPERANAPADIDEKLLQELVCPRPFWIQGT